MLAILSSLQVLQSPESIIDDILVVDEGDFLTLRIKTSVPIHYESHYPKGPSNFVQIKVSVVSLTGTEKNELLGKK